MAKTKVPSLSSAGWLGEVSDKADKLMAYYLTTDYSQTHLYPKQVVSLAYHIAEYSNNYLDLEVRVRIDLEQYFKRYFDDVEIIVSVSAYDPEEPSLLNLTLDVVVVQDGVSYSLGREIGTKNGSIITILNRG